MRRRSIVTVIAVAGVALITSCGSGDGPASLVGYRTGPGERQLVVVVQTGPSDTIGPGKILSQDPAAVRVDVRMTRAKGAQPALAVNHEVTLTLDAALGSREVHGPTGRALPLIQPPKS